MSQPMVTVLLAVHNGLPEVERAIDSILAQEFEDLEFLVIDDGSTDGTPEYLEGLADRRVRVIRVEHQGLAAALNLGIGEARGTYIARQDDDDVSMPTRLSRQVEFLEANPETVLVGSDFWFAGTDGSCLRVGTPPRTDLRISWTLLFHNVFSHGSAMFRREPAVAIGGYHPLVRSQDYDLWARLSRVGPVGVVPEVLYHWTQDPDGLSGHAGKPLQDRLATEAAIENVAETLGGNLPEELAESIHVLGNGREWEVEPRLVSRTSRKFIELERAFLARRPFPRDDVIWLRQEVRRRIAKLAARSGTRGVGAVLRTLPSDPGLPWQYLRQVVRRTIHPVRSAPEDAR